MGITLPGGRGGGSGGGFTAAVDILKSGGGRAIEVAFTRDDAGADWALRARLPVAGAEAYVDLFSNGAGSAGVRLTLDPSFSEGAAGNSRNIYFNSSTSAGVSFPNNNYGLSDPTHGDIRAIRMFVNAAATLSDVVAAAGGVNYLSAALINGATGSEAIGGFSTFANKYGNQQGWAGDSRVAQFHDGVNAREQGFTVNASEKLYELVYAAATTITDIVGLVDALGEAEAELVHGVDGTGTAEVPPYTRALEGRRGAAGEDGEDGEEGPEADLVEMPFLHAVLATSANAGVGLEVDGDVVQGWNALRMVPGTESSADVDEHFRLPAGGAVGVETVGAGRVMVFAEITLDGVPTGTSGSSRRFVELQLAHSDSGGGYTNHQMYSDYIRQGIAGEFTVGFTTWVNPVGDEGLEVHIRRLGQSPDLQLKSGRFGFARMVAAQGEGSDGVGGQDDPGGSTVAYHAVTHEGATTIDRVEAEADVEVVGLWYIVASSGTSGSLAGQENKLVRKTVGDSFEFRTPVTRLPYFLIADTLDADDDESWLATVIWTGAAWKRFTPGVNNTVIGSSVAFGGGNTVTGEAAGALGDGNTVSGDQGFAAGRQNTVSGHLGVALGDDHHVQGRAAVALGEDNRILATGSRAVAGGLQNAISRAYGAIFGKDGVVGHGDTLFGWAWGAAKPTDAQQIASEDRNLVGKVKTDGKLVFKSFWKSADPNTSDGVEIGTAQNLIDIEVFPKGIPAFTHAELNREFTVHIEQQYTSSPTQDQWRINFGPTQVHSDDDSTSDRQVYRFTPDQAARQAIIDRFGANATEFPITVIARKENLDVQYVSRVVLVGDDYAPADDPPVQQHVETPYARTLYSYQVGVGAPAFASALYLTRTDSAGNITGYELSNWESHWEPRPRFSGNLTWIVHVDRDPATGLPVFERIRIFNESFQVRYYAEPDTSSANSDTFDEDVHKFYRLRNANGQWGPFTRIEDRTGLQSHAWTQIFSLQGDFHNTGGKVLSGLGGVNIGQIRFREFCFEVANSDSAGVSFSKTYRTPALPVHYLTGLAAHDATIGTIANQVRVSVGGTNRVSSLCLTENQDTADAWPEYDGAEFVAVLRKAAGDTNAGSDALESVFFKKRAGTGTNHLRVRMLAR